VTRAPGVTADLELALTLADAADAVSTVRFRAADLAVGTKPDATPVSDADRAVEQALRDLLARRARGDGILGEEFGRAGAPAGGGRQWILDPIDGTKNFVRGAPVWATLIALRVDDTVTVGVASAPALGRRWWAARGRGAWVRDPLGGPRRCRVSAVPELTEGRLSYSSLSGWPAAGRMAGFLRLAGQAAHTRAFGDFWSHLLVAEGAVDVSCEPDVAVWDLAALQVVVEEAGGRFTDLTGAPRADGGSVLASNGLVHEAALRALSGD
jgi:histidinol-phosphatase